ncbi:cysteine-rich receptor-like protein kinase 2-like [Dorcoceras hygrometricum]|uniref:Cysteine-rich receptor-like protein kinase 2-like n=1 Tax=Dorcoceras hygrometricum TaxID=472368 RepID=A0A2Z7AVF5_9LAMI|nr:cysteine-rich receptor-like protein kinase 2-like [Dorcoceras hygrometricum]
MYMSMIICLSSCAPHGFEFFCMASVHGLLEGSGLFVKWFMVVLGVAFRGSKWRFKGRTGGLKFYTVQCVFTVCRVRLVHNLHGMAPAVVAGARIMNENTSRWSRGVQYGWSVTLEPSGPGGGPVGRVPAVVAGSGRTNVKTGDWSRRQLVQESVF